MGQNDNSDGTAGIAGDKTGSGENSTINLESGQVHRENNDKSSVVEIEVAGTADRARAVEIAADHQTVEQTEAVEIAVDRQTTEHREAVEITVDRQSTDHTEAVEIVVVRQTTEHTEAVEIAVDRQTEAVEVTVDRQTADQTEAAGITVDRQTTEQTGITVDRQTTEQTGITVDRQTTEQTGITVDRQTTEQTGITVDRQTTEQTGITVDRQTTVQTGITVDRQTATETVEIPVGHHQTVGQTKSNDESKSGNDEQVDRKSNSDRSNEESPNQSGSARCSIGKVDDGAENLRENMKTERSNSFSELTTIVINDKGDKTKKKQSTNWEKFKCYFLLLLAFLLALWVVLYFSFITGYPIPFVKKVLESWGFKV